MKTLRLGTGEVGLPEGLQGAAGLWRKEPEPLADPVAAVAAALARPLGGVTLPDLLSRGRRLTVVVPDGTRLLPVEMVESLLDTLGGRPFAVRVANGTHRRATAAEQQRVLGRHFSQVPHGDRHADDPFAHRALGESPWRLDVQAAAAEALLCVGAVSFHYLAGFGGGGKLLAPGLADRATAEWIHRACLAEGGGRHPLARAGVLEGNPLQERIEQVCQAAPPQLHLAPVLDSRGQAIHLFAGERRAVVQAAAAALRQDYALPCRRAPLVVVSAGGHPYDVDFVQGHKALEAAASACQPGGTIVLLAACPEGLPPRHLAFLKAHPDAARMEAALRQRFDIAAHTVWAARLKAERYQVRMVTHMPPDQVQALGMTPCPTLEDALSGLDLRDALLMPFGARFLPLAED